MLTWSKWARRSASPFHYLRAGAWRPNGPRPAKSHGGLGLARNKTDRHAVHVLWNYAYEMQMSFGIFANLAKARAAWVTIRNTGLFETADGTVIPLATEELDGTWTIETYVPGHEPQETVLQFGHTGDESERDPLP